MCPEKRTVRQESLKDGMVFIFPDRPIGAPVYVVGHIKNRLSFKRIWPNGSNDMARLKWLQSGREIILIHEP